MRYRLPCFPLFLGLGLILSHLYFSWSLRLNGLNSCGGKVADQGREVGVADSLFELAQFLLVLRCHYLLYLQRPDFFPALRHLFPVELLAAEGTCVASPLLRQALVTDQVLLQADHHRPFEGQVVVLPADRALLVPVI